MPGLFFLHSGFLYKAVSVLTLVFKASIWSTPSLQPFAFFAIKRFRLAANYQSGSSVWETNRTNAQPEILQLITPRGAQTQRGKRAVAEGTTPDEQKGVNMASAASEKSGACWDYGYRRDEDEHGRKRLAVIILPPPYSPCSHKVLAIVFAVDVSQITNAAYWTDHSHKDVVFLIRIIM